MKFFSASWRENSLVEIRVIHSEKNSMPSPRHGTQSKACMAFNVILLCVSASWRENSLVEIRVIRGE